MSEILLIHPPVALPCEPPLGLGILAAQLREAGCAAQVIDANVEALHQLLFSVEEEAGISTAERRSVRRRELVLGQLRSWRGYDCLDRYRGALADAALLLKQATAAFPDIRLGLADYHDQRSPFKSQDLLEAARQPSQSPFYPYFSELAERAAQGAHRVIGISINYLHQVLPGLALAGVIHQRVPRVPLVLGGALMECWQGRLAASALSPFVDRISFGSGVDLLLEELQGQPARSPSAKIGPPDYEGMPWSLYLAPVRIAPFSTSIGCVWGRCKYCPEAVSPTSFWGLEAQGVPRLLDRAASQSGAELLHVTDNAIPPEVLRAIAEQGCSSGWYGFVRFYPQLAEEEHCRALRRAGCVMLQIGLESGSEEMLRRLNKGIRLELVSRCLRALHRAGISVYLYVMFGIPGESEAEAQKTVQFIIEHAPYIRYLNTSVLNYPVQSPMDQDLDFRPYDPDSSDLNLYTDFRQANGWDRRSVRYFLEKHYSKNKDISPILRRTPTVFGANHAPLFELAASF